MGKVRSIGSIILTSMGGGTKLLAKTWWAVRKGRKEVKKASEEFYKTLRGAGIAEDIAKDITLAYAGPAWEMLKVTNLIKIAMDMSEYDSSLSISI